jgi:hypothetical protein
VNSTLVTIQKTGRLTCAWVPTGDPKSPLACVWREVELPHGSSSGHMSTNIEVGELRLCT